MSTVRKFWRATFISWRLDCLSVGDDPKLGDHLARIEWGSAQELSASESVSVALSMVETQRRETRECARGDK
jgi:hypothetical protein